MGDRHDTGRGRRILRVVVELCLALTSGLTRNSVLSRTRVFFCFAACLVLTSPLLRAHDPHDPITIVAVSPNFAQDQTVLAATGILSIKIGVQPILKSTDGGVSWTPLAGLTTNFTTTGVCFSPGYAQDQTIYVSTDSGLFVTTNQGESWAALSTQSIESLALSPNFANDGTLFVVTISNTILKSTNRGHTLTPVAAPAALTSNLSVIAISPNYAADQTLLLGSGANGIFKSVNAGASWSPVAAAVTSLVTALVFSPGFSSDQTALAGTYGSGILVSRNGGNTWTPSDSGLSDGNVTSLALSPAFLQDSTLWATTAVAGVFESTTLAATWLPATTVTRTLSNLTTTHYQTIAAASTGGGNVLFMGMYEGLWTSSGGSPWQYIDTVPTRLIRYIHVSPNYTKDQTVFATTYGSGNLWTYNGGTTWAVQNTGMQAPYTDASGISPTFGTDGIAFSSNYLGLQRTTNGGGAWTMMTGTGSAAYPRGLAISPNFSNDHTVYIGTTSTSSSSGSCYPGPASKPAVGSNTPGLYISTDAGNTWTLSSLSNVGIISIAMSPSFATDHTAFAACDSCQLYKTASAGANWTPLTLPGSPQGIAKVAVSPTSAQIVFAGAVFGGVYKSTNGGSTWTEVQQTGTIRAMDIEISPNYSVDQTLFVGTVQYGLMKSTNGGSTLTQVTTFPDSFVMAVGISPNFATDKTVFAAGYHGLFKSTDGGTTWTYMVTPQRIEETRNITSILQEPPTITYQGVWSFTAGSLVASTYGYAVTPEAQDTATLSFMGSAIRWVSWTGPTQGSASLQLDGASAGTVSLTGSSDQYQQVVWQQQGLVCGLHTLTVTGLPQSGQTVSLDAFDLGAEACPMIYSSSPAALGNNSALVGSEAGNGSVLLTTGGPWGAFSNASWLHVAAGSASGSGNALIEYSYDANPNASPQTGALTIAGLTFIVTQAGASYVPANPVASLSISGLKNPGGVAVGGQGSVYIADTGNNAVKVWSPSTQQVTTLVPSGLLNPAAVAVDAYGSVYIADSGDNAIKEWNAGTQQVTTLVPSGLSNPSGVAVDGLGNVYFSNAGGNTIGKWTASTQKVSTLVGSGLSGPTGVGVDVQGNVYFADSGHNAIKEYSVANGQVTNLVSSGLSNPTGVAVDGYGDVYFADTGNNAIKEWNGANVTTLVSTGLSSPAGTAVDRLGNVYIADTNNSAIKQFTAAYVSLSYTSRTENAVAGTDSVTAQVLPAGTLITASSNQTWLTITGTSGGTINFSFTANTSWNSRTALINVLGSQVTITQSGDTPAKITAVAGNKETTVGGHVFPTNLQVRVWDAAGNYIQGAPVTFTPSPGPTGSDGVFSGTPPMPIPTNPAGLATAPPLLANKLPGFFQVAATSGGVTINFKLTIVLP